ncbi:MAG: TonB family protein, partial [Rhodothermales bacterium]|nr:TonB family protein [Rhodothermales bacterium]
ASTRIYHDWARLNDVNPLGPIRFEIADSLIELSGIIVAADSSELVPGTRDSNSPAVDSTLAVADSITNELPASLPDSLDAPPFTIPADSSYAAEADPGNTDSTAIRPVYLSDILTTIQTRFPESEFADQARLLVVNEGVVSDEEAERPVASRDRQRPSKDVDVDSSSEERPERSGRGELERADGEIRPGDVRAEESRTPPDGNAAKPETPDETAAVAASDVEVTSEPVVIGGMESIRNRVIFPEEVGEFPEGGSVVVEFVVTSDGFVSNPRVAVGMNADFDREALRVIRETRFRPAINAKSQPVAFKMQLEIEFSPLSARQ